MSAPSLLGLGVGLAAGLAAGLLAAPMRGAEMRRSLRSRADGALDRGKTLLGEGRRAFRPRGTLSPATPGTAPLSATFGEIAQMHAGTDLSSFREARS
jgi:hypothetical protein